MSCYCAPAPKPALLYLAECSYGRLGREFQATDRDTNSRAEIVRQIRNGGINPVKILEVDEVAGTCRDCTEELLAEAAEARPSADFPALDDLRQQLIDLDRDHKRDLRKNGVHGW